MPVFTANVPGVLKVGDRIEIGGKIKENARKMSVNLCAQEGEEPRDVVLHFDVRFHRDNIISLSRKNGVWIGSGNYDTNYNMFVPGTIFRIVFEVKDTDVITIYCQGKFHSNFLPKIPLSMAKYLVAWADVERITHCYFYLGCKQVTSGDELGPPGAYGAPPARVAAAVGDTKRTRSRKKSMSPPLHSSNESSEDDPNHQRPKSEGRADRFFYDSLMCPQDNTKAHVPDKHRADPNAPRRFAKNTECSESERNFSEEAFSETNSKLESSTADSEDILPDLDLKKRVRRSKFPLSQVVNFMSKSRRN